MLPKAIKSCATFSGAKAAPSAVQLLAQLFSADDAAVILLVPYGHVQLYKLTWSAEAIGRAE